MSKEKKQQYISLAQAAQQSSYTQEYLSLRARQGKLKAVKIGRNWTTTKEWLEEYISQAEEYKNGTDSRSGNQVSAGNLVSKISESPAPENLPVELFPGDPETVPWNVPWRQKLFGALRIGAVTAALVFLVLFGFAFGKEGWYQAAREADRIAQSIGEEFDSNAQKLAMGASAAAHSLASGADATAYDVFSTTVRKLYYGAREISFAVHGLAQGFDAETKELGHMIARGFSAPAALDELALATHDLMNKEEQFSFIADGVARDFSSPGAARDIALEYVEWLRTEIVSAPKNAVQDYLALNIWLEQGIRADAQGIIALAQEAARAYSLFGHGFEAGIREGARGLALNYQVLDNAVEQGLASDFERLNQGKEKAQEAGRAAVRVAQQVSQDAIFAAKETGSYAAKIYGTINSAAEDMVYVSFQRTNAFLARGVETGIKLVKNALEFALAPWRAKDFVLDSAKDASLAESRIADLKLELEKIKQLGAIPGLQGPPGEPGPQGERGLQGLAGPAGPKGTAGTGTSAVLASVQYSQASVRSNQVSFSGNYNELNISRGKFTIDSGGGATGASLIITGDVAFDTSTFFVDSASNRVGIGTTTPSVPLDIVGNAALDGDLEFQGAQTISTTSGNLTLNAAGSIVIPDGDLLDLSAIVHDDTANQGLLLPQAASATPSSPTSGEGYLAWDTAGNQLLTYNGSTWASVSGTAAGSDGQLQYNNGGSDFGGAAQLYWDDANNRLGLYDSSPDAILEIVSSGGNNLFALTDTTDGDVFMVNNAGLVGIGNASPLGAYLDIGAATASLAQVNLTTSAGTNVSSPASGDLWWNGTNLYFYNGSSNADLLATGGNVAGSDGQLQYNNGGSDFGGAAQLYWDDANNRLGLYDSSPDAILEIVSSGGNNLFALTDTTDGDVFMVDNAGNVGIGTAAPTAALSFGSASTINTLVGALTLAPIAESNLNITLSGAGDFAVNTNQLYVDTSAGFVGIGTATPGALLSVATDGTNDAFRIGDNGAGNILTVQNGGRVGIGTATPTSILEIAGNSTQIYFSGTNGPFGLRFNDDTTTGMQMIYRTSPDKLIWEPVSDITDGTDIMTLDRSGNLYVAGNVGINTAVPQSLLDVQGAAGAAGILTLATKELTVVDGDKLGQINFNAPLESDGSDAILAGASIWAEADDTFSATVNSTELVFGTATTSAAVERMRIDSSGKVGIGTATPGALLSVATDGTNDAFRIGDNGAGNILTVQNGGNVGIGTASPSQKLHIESSSGAAMLFRSTGADAAVFIDSALGSTANIRLKENGVDKWIISNDGSDDKLKIATTKNGNMFTIDTTGNVGIGDTSPDALLEIVSSGGSNLFALTDTTDGDVFIVDNAGNVGIGTATPGALLSVATDGTNDAFRIGDNGAGNILTVQNGGNVGIGTTAPGAPLEVAGTSGISILSGFAAGGLYLGADVNAVIRSSNVRKVGVIRSPNYANNANIEVFSLNSPDASTNTVSFGGRSGGSSTAATEINFITAPDTTTTGGTVRMYIGSTGNVGIGDTSPDALLEIVSSGGSNLFALTDTTDGDVFIVDSSGNVGIGTASPGALLSVATDGTNDAFRIGDNGAGNILTVQNGGKVGIGTASPTNNLSIGSVGVGTFTGIGVGASANADLRIGQGTTNNVIMGWKYNATPANAYAIVETYGGSNSLALQSSGGSVGINTTVPQSLLDVQGAAGAAGILTLATKELTVVDGDKLGQINFNAPLESDGSDAILAGASIWAEADDTFSATVNSTELVFGTATTSAAVERMRIDSSGKVGIGTATPGALLSVATDGTNDVFRIGDNGAGNILTVQNGGNVGIGTASPGAKLDVRGTILTTGHSTESAVLELGGARTDSGYAYIDLHGDTTYSDYGLRLIRNNTGANASSILSHRGTGALAIRALDAGNVTLGSDNSDDLTIISGGNVGINTTVPQSLLDVQGAAGAAGILTLATKELTVVDGDKLGQINFNAPLESDGSDAILAGASIWAEADDTFSATVNSTELVFGTATTSAAVERMRIDSSGKVGIGTATPGALLSVATDGANDAFRIGDNGAGNILTVQNGGNVGIGTASPGTKLEVNLGGVSITAIRALSGGVNNYTAIGIGRTSLEGALAIAAGAGQWSSFATTGDIILRSDTEDLILGARNATGSLRFATGFPDTEKMTILSGGNVGIGDTTPDALLEIVSSGGKNLFALTDTTDGDVFMVNNAGRVGIGDTTPDAALEIVTSGTTDAFHISSTAARDGDLFTITALGNVGIGTASPGVALELGADKSFRITGGTAFPASPSEGQMFFRTDTTQLYVYANAKWQADRTTATKIVAASDSSNEEKADYVADGTNDEVTIEAALAALPAGGGMVFLLEGTYSIGAAIDITQSKVSLVGSGKATILQRAANAIDVIVVGNAGTAYERVIISNLQIDGAKATHTSGANDGIVFNQKITNSEILDTWIHDNAGSGIYLLSGGTSGTANNDNVVRGNKILSNGGYGLVIATYGSRNRIENNDISSNTNSGILFSTGAYNNMAIGNRIASNSSNGIEIGRGEDNMIANNYINSNTGDGVRIAGDGNDTAIIGNYIELNTGDAIDTTTGTQASERHSIVSNLIIDDITLGGTGIHLVSSNRVTGNITINASSNDNYLAGNTISGTITDNGSNNVIQHSSQFKIESTSATVVPLTITADSLAAANGIALSVDGLTTGTGLDISSTSTAGGASGVSKLINLSRSGTNANASHTAYGLYSAVTNTGTTSTNIAGYFSASGATNNYAGIFENGSVGIGDTTPDALLEIVSSGGKNLFALTDTTDGDVFMVNNAGRVGIGDTTPDATLEVVTIGTTDAFHISSTAAGDGDLLTVTALGNVGIGAASPGSKLTIGSGSFDLSSQGSILNVGNSGSDLTDGVWSVARSNNQAQFSVQTFDDAGNTPPVLNLASALSDTIGTYTAVTNTTVLGRIDFQGADGTGFGTGTRIEGVATETFSGSATGAYLSFYTTDTGTNTKDERLRIDQDGGIFMYAMADNLVEDGAVCISGDELSDESDGLCDASSIKVKTDVRDLDYGIAELMQLRPVFFRYKEDFKPDFQAVRAGFIAEEMNLVIPEVVTYDSYDEHGIPNGDPDGIDYGKLTAVLTKAMQEQQKQIEELEQSLLTVAQNISGELVNVDPEYFRQGLSSLGLAVNTNGVLEVDTLKAKKAVLDTLELKDQLTGKVWCTWIENGEWQKVEANCEQISYLNGQLVINGQPADYDAIAAANGLVLEPQPEEPAPDSLTDTVSDSIFDSTPPIISLLGPSLLEIELNAEYVDAGATATDDVDGDISANIAVDNPVDTSVLGAYFVTYTVSDAAGNKATPATRTVNVVEALSAPEPALEPEPEPQDSMPPVITLLGEAVVELEVGGIYEDAGATAADDVDGDITANIIVSNPVDTATVGAYTVTYIVSDAAGNEAAPAARTVNVVLNPI